MTVCAGAWMWAGRSWWRACHLVTSERAWRTRRYTRILRCKLCEMDGKGQGRIYPGFDDDDHDLDFASNFFLCSRRAFHNDAAFLLIFFFYLPQLKIHILSTRVLVFVIRDSESIILVDLLMHTMISGVLAECSVAHPLDKRTGHRA